MNREEINNELKALQANKLAQLPVRSCFLVYSSYFPTLETTVLRQILPTSEGLKVPDQFFSQLEASILDETIGAKKVTPHFSIPNDYFVELETEVFNQTIGQETPIKTLLNIKQPLLVWSSVAASFIIGFLLFNQPKIQACVTFACLLEQSQLTEDDFLQVYDATVADELLETVNFSDGLDVNDDELIDFLIDEEIELHELTNVIES